MEATCSPLEARQHISVLGFWAIRRKWEARGRGRGRGEKRRNGEGGGSATLHQYNTCSFPRDVKVPS